MATEIKEVIKKRGRPKKLVQEEKSSEEKAALKEKSLHRDIINRIEDTTSHFYTLGIGNLNLKSPSGLAYLNNGNRHIISNKQLVYNEGYTLDKYLVSNKGKHANNNLFVAGLYKSVKANTTSANDLKAAPFYKLLTIEGNAQRIYYALRAQVYLHNPDFTGDLTIKNPGKAKEIFIEALFTALLFADYSKFPTHIKGYLNSYTPIEAILHIVSLYIVKEIILK